MASIVKYGNDGNIIWSNEHGPHVTLPYVFGICADGNGNVYCTGTCDSQNNIFGNDTINVVQNNPQNFVAKVSPFPADIKNTFTEEIPVALYPNPNNGSFTVSHQSLHRYSRYDVISVTGQVVCKGTFQPVNNLANIHTGLLPQGVYILLLYSKEDTIPVHLRIE